MLNKDELVSQLGNIVDVDTIQGVTVSNPIKKNTELVVLPRADYVMHEKDHLLVVGLTKDIDRLLASIK